MAKIDNLFHLLHANHGSDLHLSAGNPPLLRIYGDLARVDAPVVTTEELLAVLREMVPMERVQAFEQTGDLDFAYEIPGLARYRANFFRQNRGISAVFREIPQRISTVEELGLPIMLRELALLPKGLVLVTGPTGSGKSTSLYSILQLLNKPDVNAITLEDPVEYRIDGIRQVQLNVRAGMTFASGLRSILRQDPDVIMVGEIRDSETAQIACCPPCTPTTRPARFPGSWKCTSSLISSLPCSSARLPSALSAKCAPIAPSPMIRPAPCSGFSGSRMRKGQPSGAGKAATTAGTRAIWAGSVFSK